MISDRYNPLPQLNVCTKGCFVLGSRESSDYVRIDSPALDVMTDLLQVQPVTVEPGDTIGQANQIMIVRGVRLLLVVETGEARVIGVITARDLLGEKPVRLASHRGIRRDELMVRDVMTTLDAMEAMDMDDVRASRVGHIIATLEKCGRQHAVVFEMSEDGRQILRGIFSASQIARQLGVDMTTHEVARTFAEIEAVFAGV